MSNLKDMFDKFEKTAQRANNVFSKEWDLALPERKEIDKSAQLKVEVKKVSRDLLTKIAMNTVKVLDS